MASARVSLAAIYNATATTINVGTTTAGTYTATAVAAANTLTAADLAQAPDDVRGNIEIAMQMLNGATALLERVQTVCSQAGDSTNVTAIGNILVTL